MTPGKLQTYSDLEIALMILLGCYGNGQHRKDMLGDRYGVCQSIVDYILNNDEVPNGSGNLDPKKLQDAVNAVFEDVLHEVKEEIIEKYEK